MMNKVVTTQGDLWVVVAIDHDRRLDGQTIRQAECIHIPITFNTLREAEQWCEETQVKNRDYLIIGTWNPLTRGA